MAEERFYTILTNVGKAKVANAALLNSNVSLTTLKVGDGNGAYYNPTEEQTELKNTVYTCNVGSVSVDKDNPNWIVAETIIPGSVGGFTIREVGLFDVEGDLIAIGKYPETYKPIVQSGASKDLNVRTIFEVSNAASVNLSINPSIIIATKEDIENLQKQVTKNTTDLKEKANLISTVQTTTKDSYIYVAKNGSDDNDGLSSSTPFLTVGKAISIIPSYLSHNVTINIGDGIYNEDIELISIGGNKLITIKGNVNNIGNVKVNSVFINSCTSLVVVLGIETISSSLINFTCTNSVYIDLQKCKCITSSILAGIRVSMCKCVISNCELSNRIVGIISDYNADVFSNNNTGSGNTVGLQATNNGTIGKYQTQPSGTTAENASRGGIIR